MKKTAFLSTSLILLAFVFSITFIGAGKAPPPVEEMPEEVDLTVPITVLVTDPHIQVVDTWKPIWEAQTGGKIEVVLVPYATLEEKMWLEFRTQTGSFDIACVPVTWLGEVFGGGHVESIQKYIDKYGYPDWDDVMPAAKRIIQWQGEVMALPYDGDNHMTYYRKDALEVPEYQQRFKREYGYSYSVPPANWSEVRDIAEFFDEWDWDNDGEIEYGVAFIAQQNSQAMWSFMDICAQYTTIAGPASNYTSNIFFDTETMEPLCKSPGWVEAMTMIQELTNYAPPGLLGYGYSELRQAFVSGNSAIAFDWGDIGIQEQKPVEYGSKVKGLLGYGPLPGAKKYYDRKTNKWIEEQHTVNFLNFGGWVWVIPKAAPEKDAAYHFGIYMTNKEHSLLDVCGIHGYTGANPWRWSHFKTPEAWVRGGWGEESVKGYLKAISDILQDPYAVPDLMIPGTPEYYTGAGSSLDVHLNKVLSGQISPEEACKRIYDDWVRITEEKGFDEQKAFYRASMGVD